MPIPEPPKEVDPAAAAESITNLLPLATDDLLVLHAGQLTRWNPRSGELIGVPTLLTRDPEKLDRIVKTGNISARPAHPEQVVIHSYESISIWDLARQKDIKDITGGLLGEFDHEMLLPQYDRDQKASGLSAHLRGGRFKILAVGPDRKPVLVYASEWDSIDEAKRFFQAYGNILKGKWKHFDVAVRTDSTLAGTGDNGMFVTRLNGTAVTSVEGLFDAAEWQRLQAPPPVLARRSNLRVTAQLRCRAPNLEELRAGFELNFSWRIL